MKYLRPFRAACCAPGRFSTSRRAGAPLECFSWYLFFFACPPAGGRTPQKAKLTRSIPPQMIESQRAMGADAAAEAAQPPARANGDDRLCRVHPGSMLSFRPRLFLAIFGQKLAKFRTITVKNRTLN